MFQRSKPGQQIHTMASLASALGGKPRAGQIPMQAPAPPAVKAVPAPVAVVHPVQPGTGMPSAPVRALDKRYMIEALKQLGKSKQQGVI